jgi:hypothetical protein
VCAKPEVGHYGSRPHLSSEVYSRYPGAQGTLTAGVLPNLFLSNGFVLKLNAAGSVDWAFAMTGPLNTFTNSLALSPDAQWAVAAGQFSNSVTFGEQARLYVSPPLSRRRNPNPSPLTCWPSSKRRPAIN